jgi:hypothetical protein
MVQNTAIQLLYKNIKTKIQRTEFFLLFCVGLKFRLFFPLKDNVKGAKEDIWTRERGVKE